MEDKFNLERFETRHKETYDTAYHELNKGKKQSHWMWWIFPQICGLGISQTSKDYSINSRKEAKAFLDHPYLGNNLREICKVLLEMKSSDPYYVFGYPDEMKLCSSMTLFSEIAPEEDIFENVLKKFFKGQKDVRSIEIIKNLRC